jgi:Co/Zn/Cd efflux system component
MIVITIWAYSLIKSAATVLLNAVPNRAHAVLIRNRLDTEGNHVADFHLCRLGPGHPWGSCGRRREQTKAAHYNAKPADIEGLSQVNIEVNSYHSESEVECGTHSTDRHA